MVLLILLSTQRGIILLFLMLFSKGIISYSFKEFSIPTGGSATFQNYSAIVNIINWVTAGNVSNIDGLIKANR
ncbi:MAG: filamentous hemagglutinin N-terminal domain-containing protein [Cyanobacteria bacterium J06635_10]